MFVPQVPDETQLLSAQAEADKRRKALHIVKREMSIKPQHLALSNAHASANGDANGDGDGHGVSSVLSRTHSTLASTLPFTPITVVWINLRYFVPNPRYSRAAERKALKETTGGAKQAVVAASGSGRQAGVDDIEAGAAPGATATGTSASGRLTRPPSAKSTGSLSRRFASFFSTPSFKRTELHDAATAAAPSATTVSKAKAAFKNIPASSFARSDAAANAAAAAGPGAAPASAESAGPAGAGAVLKKQLQLLDGVTGYSEPGVLMALMGGSGAGKTTLMDVLAGRKTVGETTGSIYVNGHPKTQNTWSRVVGYVEQQDVHSANQTVVEALWTSARLRLPATITDEQVKCYVDEVMDMVGLMDQAFALVGSPGGGAGLNMNGRKRLTIAVELVANPAVVFMDEPTSGLDARAAALVSSEHRY